MLPMSPVLNNLTTVYVTCWVVVAWHWCFIILPVLSVCCYFLASTPNYNFLFGRASIYPWFCQFLSLYWKRQFKPPQTWTLSALFHRLAIFLFLNSQHVLTSFWIKWCARLTLMTTIPNLTAIYFWFPETFCSKNTNLCLLVRVTFPFQLNRSKPPKSLSGQFFWVHSGVQVIAFTVDQTNHTLRNSTKTHFIQNKPGKCETPVFSYVLLEFSINVILLLCVCVLRGWLLQRTYNVFKVMFYLLQDFKYVLLIFPCRMTLKHMEMPQTSSAAAEKNQKWRWWARTEKGWV